MAKVNLSKILPIFSVFLKCKLLENIGNELIKISTDN